MNFDEELKKYLNYQGPVFLRSNPNPEHRNEPRIMQTDMRLCKECGKETTHDYVKDLDTKYWRCKECLEKQLKEKGIYIPPHRGGSRTAKKYEEMFKNG